MFFLSLLFLRRNGAMCPVIHISPKASRTLFMRKKRSWTGKGKSSFLLLFIFFVPWIFFFKEKKFNFNFFSQPGKHKLATTRDPKVCPKTSKLGTGTKVRGFLKDGCVQCNDDDVSKKTKKLMILVEYIFCVHSTK